MLVDDAVRSRRVLVSARIVGELHVGGCRTEPRHRCLSA